MPNELLDKLTEPLVQERKALIDENFKAQSTFTNREQFLHHHLALALIFLEFERHYRLIFGSQLRLLQTLSSTPGMELSEIEAFFFLPIKQTHSAFYVNYTFEQWLEYLREAGLVQITGKKVFITDKGKEFLKFLIQFGYPIEKVA
jgi:hypothetical protein